MTADPQRSRLAPASPPYSADVEQTLKAMTPPGHAPLKLFRVLANNPPLLDAFRRFGTYLLRSGSVAPRDREIIIQRATARCGAAYEWAVHVYFFSEGVDLTTEQLDATLRADGAESPLFSSRERLLIRLVDELHDTSHVSDGLWRELAVGWSAAELTELVSLAGQYHLVSFIVNAFGVEHEDYVDPMAFESAASDRGRGK